MAAHLLHPWLKRHKEGRGRNIAIASAVRTVGQEAPNHPGVYLDPGMLPHLGADNLPGLSGSEVGCRAERCDGFHLDRIWDHLGDKPLGAALQDNLASVTASNCVG